MLRSIWYVATRGSVFLRRTSIAAMPMPTRSSERNRSSASCCVSPIANPSLIPDAATSLRLDGHLPRAVVARVFRRGGFLRNWRQTLASEEARYKRRYKNLPRDPHAVGKFHFARSRNQSGPRTLLIIPPQARQILLIQRKINVLSQIALQFARGNFQLQGRALGDFANARQAIIARGLKIRGDFRRDRAAPRHPDRQHRGQPG